MTPTLRAACLGASAVFLMAGCSTPAPKESGFLKNYSNLHKEDAPGGGSRLVYVNPAFTPAKYQAVWLAPLEFYPAPQPTDQVSMSTLEDIRSYADQTLRQKVGQQVRLSDKPGPGIAHLQVAITAVGTETQALKAYQYIPVAFVLTSAVDAVEGGRAKDASVAIESRVTDSVTGELLFASVRGGTGEKIQSASQGQGGVQTQNLKPLIDLWSAGAATEVAKYVTSK